MNIVEVHEHIRHQFWKRASHKIPNAFSSDSSEKKPNNKK